MSFCECVTGTTRKRDTSQVLSLSLSISLSLFLSTRMDKKVSRYFPNNDNIISTRDLTLIPILQAQIERYCFANRKITLRDDVSMTTPSVMLVTNKINAGSELIARNKERGSWPSFDVSREDDSTALIFSPETPEIKSRANSAGKSMITDHVLTPSNIDFGQYLESIIRKGVPEPYGNYFLFNKITVRKDDPLKELKFKCSCGRCVNPDYDQYPSDMVVKRKIVASVCCCCGNGLVHLECCWCDWARYCSTECNVKYKNIHARVCSKDKEVADVFSLMMDAAELHVNNLILKDVLHQISRSKIPESRGYEKLSICWRYFLLKIWYTRIHILSEIVSL